jgi:septation ring formation regulator EzrA
MKEHVVWAVVVIAALALVAGCGDRVDSWRQEAREMTEAAETRLQEVSATIDSLQENAVTATAGARKDIEEQLRDLEEKERAARERLAELREATGERWKYLRRRLDEAMESLEETFARSDTVAADPD